MSKQEEASKLDGTWGTSVGTDRSFLLKEKKMGKWKTPIFDDDILQTS